MKTLNAAFQIWRRLRPPLLVALVFLALFLESFSAPAADADKDGKGGANAPSQAGAKKPAVRIIILNGTYLDYPSAADVDPMSLLLGGLEKPGSFFALCEKLGELAGDDEIQHVLFDLSSPTLSMNLAQVSELPRHIHKLRDAGKGTFALLQSADTIHYAIASSCETI